MGSSGITYRMKCWEIIADNLSKAGWSLGCVSAVGFSGRTIWMVDAHRNGKRFVVHADEKLTAFLELESAICACGEFVLTNEMRFREILAPLPRKTTRCSGAG